MFKKTFGNIKIIELLVFIVVQNIYCVAYVLRFIEYKVILFLQIQRTKRVLV